MAAADAAIGMDTDPALALRRQFDAALRLNHNVRRPLPEQRRRLVALSRAPQATLDKLLWFVRQRRVHTTQGWTHWMTRPESERAALLNSEPAGFYAILGRLVPPSPFAAADDADAYHRHWPKTPYSIQERVLTLASPLAVDVTLALGLAPPPSAADATGFAGLVEGGGERRLADWVSRVVPALCRELAAGLCDPNWVRSEHALSTVLVLSDSRGSAVRFLWPYLCVHRRSPSHCLQPVLAALRAALPALGEAEAGTATVSFTPAETQTAPVYGSSGDDGQTLLLFAAWRDGEMGVGTAAACGVMRGLAVDLGPIGGHVIQKDDPRSLESVLPVLCSLNPNGRTVVRLRGEDAEMVLGFAPLAPLARGDLPDRLGGCTDSVANEYDAPDEKVRRAMGTLRAVHLILRLLGTQVAEDTSKVFEVGNSVASAVSRSHEGFLVWRDWVRRCCPLSALTDEALQARWETFTLDNGGLNDLVFLLRQDSGEQFQVYHALRVADCRNEPSTDLNRAMGLRRQFGNCELSDVALYVLEWVRGHVACVNTGSAKEGPEWRVFSTRLHRWKTDKSGSNVRRMAWLVLDNFVRHARANPGILGGADGGGADAGARGAGRRGGRPGMAGPSPLELLNNIVNSPRDMDVVVRTMATELEKPDFDIRLDQNDHLLPFHNGVLDVKKLVIRPGQPSDMQCKGANYAWQDRGTHDAVLRDAEYKLMTMFPDRNVCRFFVQVGASLLVKGNRHKHMFCGTGNTGGGKSLVNSLLQMAWGDAACVIPVSFLCTEDSDPGKAMDPIARSHGCSVAAAAESDPTRQRLMGGKLKRIVTPRDGFPVRMLYGSTFTMIIKWVLFLWCNSPPAISNIEDAIMQRIVFLTFDSIFTTENCVPVNSSEQIMKARFRMQTDFSPGELEATAQAMMNIFFSAYVECGMNRPNYTLDIPKRIAYSGEGFFRRATMLRRWVKSFVRPTTWTGAIISPAADEALRVLGRLVDELHAVWVQWKTRAGVGDGDAQAAVGSVEWARAACDGLRNMMPTNAQRGWPPKETPVVTTTQIMAAFNAYIAGIGGGGGGSGADGGAGAGADGAGGSGGGAGSGGSGGGARRSRKDKEADNLDPMTARRIINEELRRDEISESLYLGYTILTNDATIRAMGNLPSVQKVAQAAANCAALRLQTRGWYPPHPANLPVEEIIDAQVKFSMSEMSGGSMGQTRPQAARPDAAPPVVAVPAAAAVAAPVPVPAPAAATFRVPPDDVEFDADINACLRRSGISNVEQLRAMLHNPVDFAKTLAREIHDDPTRGSAYINPALCSDGFMLAVRHSWQQKIDQTGGAASLLALLDLGGDAMTIDAKANGRMSHFDFGFSHAGRYRALPRCEGNETTTARRTGVRVWERGVGPSVAPHPTTVIPSETRGGLREPPPEMCLFYQAEERRENLASLADDADLAHILVAAGMEREEAREAAGSMLVAKKRDRDREDAAAADQPKRPRPNSPVPPPQRPVAAPSPRRPSPPPGSAFVPVRPTTPSPAGGLSSVADPYAGVRFRTAAMVVRAQARAGSRATTPLGDLPEPPPAGAALPCPAGPDGACVKDEEEELWPGFDFDGEGAYTVPKRRRLEVCDDGGDSPRTCASQGTPAPGLDDDDDLDAYYGWDAAFSQND